MTFEEWWDAFLAYAKKQSGSWVINQQQRDSYREYYSDGDSPEDAFFQEMKIARKFY